MSSFSAYLTVGSFKTWVNSVILDMHQEIDTLGRPASATYGGKLTISFNTTADPLVTNWMFNPAKQWSGTITYVDMVGVTLKTVSFQNAFCLDLQEDFDGTNNSADMVTTIVISPEKLSIGSINHDNHWPPIEAN
ncbi:hypothetical protein FAES_5392 [Fibrella aestuarina BUZ 2]|uniref:Uncharacterized protein n=1 Tax=Fibrella aestuarina BUZ 2 TaxID=1166018 RepID=I0KGY8_9BACT|nr:type VI secretion system tube protein TssD [Fibrella aestuarina]CCH03391.1 hypothetical protein FAES_5392 [Fibrella aestuarina BUZ 2]